MRQPGQVVLFPFPHVDQTKGKLRPAMPSLIRLGRLAVVESSLLVGSVGAIAPERLKKMKDRLADCIRG